RWTERRNLACFLDLVARGRVDVEPLVSHTADPELRSRMERFQANLETLVLEKDEALRTKLLG
ncbi:hypothetical protein ACFXO7_34820, partial [Nocardia tengchongensis]